MITYEAGFDLNSEMSKVALRLTSLSAPLTPTHFSAEERITKSSIAVESINGKGIDSFVKRNDYGFFLLGEGVTYSLRIGASQKVSCDCFIKHAPVEVERLIVQMTKAIPIFGYACLSEERDSRNRIKIVQGDNQIESWVGRDTDRYIPGLYWLTLISDELASKHSTPIDKISEIAEEYQAPVENQHLFRFYSQPSRWDKESKVSKLLATTNGIFDIEKVRPTIQAASTYKDLTEILRRWK